MTKLNNLESNIIIFTTWRKKNKSNSNDQSELADDTRTGNTIEHVPNWWHALETGSRLHDILFFWCCFFWMFFMCISRGVNRLSIIRNSIEKTDYRSWIDVVANRKSVWQYGDPSHQLNWSEKDHIMRYLCDEQTIPVSENTTHSYQHGRKMLQ